MSVFRLVVGVLSVPARLVGAVVTLFVCALVAGGEVGALLAFALLVLPGAYALREGYKAGRAGTDDEHR